MGNNMQKRQVIEISKSLSNIGNVRLPVGVLIARNLVKCKPVLNEYSQLLSYLKIKFASKDANDKLTFGKNAEEVTKGLEDFLNEEVEIDFIPIDESNFEGIEANILLPLIDNIIK